MAAEYTPQRNSQYAPCEPTCNHIDCMETRKMINSVCHFCCKSIGYGTRIYNEIDGGYVHAECLETQLDQQYKKKG